MTAIARPPICISPAMTARPRRAHDGAPPPAYLFRPRHDGQAATVEDWVRCFEDACGRDLKQFRLWYAQSGTPVVEASGHYDAQQKTYALTLKQHLAPTPGQPEKKPMHIPVRVGLVGQGGRSLPLTLDG